MRCLSLIFCPKTVGRRSVISGQWWIQEKGLAGPALIFRPNWGLKDWKKFFFETRPPRYLRVWMTAPPFIWRSGSATAGYHGSKISETQQSFLTEAAICTVKRWKKVTGYRLVLECNNYCAQVSHYLSIFFPARPELVEIQTYHGNVM